ncbi:hypothetical protein TUM4438_20650 [Shewanella sairae]|uniref:histidine kinase n=1 Tax=Shewanella sairae TaxID=190310 RepID=A0ABQ4PEY8_9GAMM|nr:hypothetical protein TUM4438_20650 [Shewanella sairae]
MSHELRTPLNGVIGFAKQLLKTPLHSSQQDYIRTIERSATNLLSIINDILDFSKLEAGKMVLENIPFSLRETIEETVTMLSSTAREKELELVIDVDASIPEEVTGDAMRFSQIITNLVGNAIKFTDKGSVQLKLHLEDISEETVHIRCEIIDTGIGIDEQQQVSLFQAFGQGDSSISRRFGGTGLGLVITKRLVNRMDGQIGCHSTPNQGSTFWFSLPLNISQYSINSVLPLAPLKGKSVLLFESSELSRHVIERMLQRWGLKITLVKNAKQLEFIATQSNHIFDFAIFGCRTLTAFNEPANILKQAKSKIDYLLLISDCAEQEEVFSQLRPYVDKQLPLPVGEKLLSSSLLDPHSGRFNEHFIAIEPIATPAKLENLSVLAVDDNPANLKLIDTLLKELVTQVQVTDNGEKAIQLAKERSYDLIFMDIQMPGTDGITATKEIRSNSANRNTPIIAVTAHAIAEERERISTSGMDGYLPKPIDEAALKGVITRWKTKPKFTHFDQRTLNWDLCLTQANNKPDLALDMLKMLLKSLPETVEHIEHALNTTDKDKMLACIHKLHGACCYCGVPTTQMLCQEIESSLKRDVMIDDVEPEILELLDELTKVESAANQVISQLSVDI